MRKPISNELRMKILKRDNFTCQYCGAKGDSVRLEIDHIRPVCLGGDNRESNLITACASCNHKKGTNRIVEMEDKSSVDDFNAAYRKQVSEYGYYTNYIKKVFKNNGLKMTRPYIYVFVKRSFHSDNDFEKFKKTFYEIPAREVMQKIVQCNIKGLSWEEYNKIVSEKRRKVMNNLSFYTWNSKLFETILKTKKISKSSDIMRRAEYYIRYYCSLVSANFKIKEFEFLDAELSKIIDISSTTGMLVKLFELTDEYIENNNTKCDKKNILGEILASLCKNAFGVPHV